MTTQENIHRVIEQAKQQRAEYIGTSIRKHPVVALLVIAIPVLLTQVQWSPSAPVAVETHGADSCQSALLGVPMAVSPGAPNAGSKIAKIS
jgi:hypothetical protein